MFSVYSLKTLVIKEPKLQTKHCSETNNQCWGAWVLGLSPGADKNMEGVSEGRCHNTFRALLRYP